MNKLAVAAIMLLVGSLLSGCGGRMELGERAFVLGVAVDLHEDMIELTSQLYKPASGSSEQVGGTIVNVLTRGETLFEAIREITLKLGRKAQWSHMQVLLIGEELAKSDKFKHSLDFFYRDHEPRLTTPVMITEGRASKILKKKALVETSVSRQLREVQRIAMSSTGKSIETNLLTLNKEMKKETSTIAISFIRESNDEEQTPVIQGGALIQRGIMVGLISPKDVQSYLMLINDFKGGIIVVGCGDGSKHDSVEVVEVETRIAPNVVGEDIHVSIKMNMSASLGEMSCVSLQTEEEMKKYETLVIETVEKQLLDSIALFKEKKVDVMGVGNLIHKRDARSWHGLKGNWEERLAEIKYDVQIKLNITSTGLETSRPIFHD